MPIHGYPGGVITANPTAPTVSSASGVWTTEQQLINQSAGRWPMAATQISRSLRFNSADSAYLNRTPASAGNRQIFTWSGWVKRSASGNVALFTARTDDSNRSSILFESENLRCFNFSGGSVTSNLVTSAVFRDFSAWYHVVISMNTTTQVGKIYVNGVEQTLGTNTVGLNSNFFFNNTNAHAIGRTEYSTPEGYFNGYMTEINFVDGLALDPSYFGFNNSDTGVWSPKQYTGAYGTNGFYLNFSDNSGTTSTTLGKDSSGNGNNWTPNNFSVTAGAGNDSLVDSPTSYGTDTGAGGEVRGNYCTLNPLQKNSTVTIANGNLDITTSSDNREVLATLSASAGKWYFEVTFTSQTNAEYIGICDTTYTLFDGSWGSQVRAYISNGNKWNGSSSSYGASYTTNDVIGVAYDIDAGTIVFYKNNSSQGTAFTDLNGKSWRPFINNGISNAVSCNFGQRAFAYTAPSGFKALCTQNLPTPTIGATSTTQANDYFNAVLWTGNATARSITGVGFQPDFVWIKNRTSAFGHLLYDVIRGTGLYLASNSTAADTSFANGLTSFDSDGFGVGTASAVNETSSGLVAWNWKANGAGSSNTAGSITSTVSANTTSGFSIVTYTAPSSGAFTVGHGLGVAPAFIITKSRSNAYSWGTYHQSIGNTGRVDLNSTSGTTTTQNSAWNNTSPTSTVFSMGSDWAGSGITYVAYCFAAVAGYSAFGSYTGNGSTDGPFVYTGFRPEYVVVKRTNDVGNWTILDVARSTANPTDEYLWANLSNAEVANLHAFDFLSNGFKLRNTTSDHNSNGSTYIYMAFAEFPFKYALAR